MDNGDIESLDIDAVLDAIYQRYGYDFKNYSRASFERRFQLFLNDTGFKTPGEILPKLLHDEEFFEAFCFRISISVTEFFRDPWVYRAIREKVIPYLKTYPFVKTWHAGIASGEEVYSMAILLKEEGIYNRTQIYTTDFNDRVIEKAKDGIYSIDVAKNAIFNYREAGGKKSFSEYYISEYDQIMMNRDLKNNITFANHNLVSDASFGEMNMVVCRNVLIYFNKDLQDHVLNLFYESLIPEGFLCLGTKETINFSSIKDRFKVISEKEKIYQKKYEI